MKAWYLWGLALGNAIRRTDTGTAASDYFVKSLPGQPEDAPLARMHAGTIEVNKQHNANLFFWHVQSRYTMDRQRTVIWLNGGPGCSSLDGALMEVGPYRVTQDGKLEENDGSWHTYANLLFVDQPVGTGFSYVNTDSFLKDLPEMAEHMMIFLDKFLSLFPEYQSDDVYLAGESFAGQHIPYICKALLDRNKKDASRFVPIKGILIGNGWIDPQRTYLSYLPFAYQSGILQGGSDAAAVVENRVSACSKSLSSLGNRIHVVECEAVLQEILAQTRTSGKCINMYDLRLRDSFPSCGMNWPPDLDYVRPYLRQDSVLRALHVSPDKTGGWVECSGQVSGVFLAQDSRPAIELLPDILAELPVLLFSGDKDVICNFRGTEEAIKALDWNGGTGLEDSNGNLAVVDEWTFNGMPAGNYQTARNLTHVIVYNASHMVPFDYARQSLDMLNRFVGLDISNDAAFESGLVGGDLRNQKPSEDRPPESNNSIENDSVKQATWLAYQRAGEVVLVVVILGAFAFGTFVYRQRKKDSRGIYFRGNGSNIRLNRAMENENELDELVLESPDASLDSFVGETISPKD